MFRFIYLVQDSDVCCFLIFMKIFLLLNYCSIIPEFFLHNFEPHKTPSTVRVLCDILEYVVSWVAYYWLCRTVYSIQLFLQCLLGYRTSAIVRCYTLHVVRCTSTMVSGAWCSVCATVRMVRDMLVWYCVRYSLCSAVFCVLYGMVVSYNF